MAFRGWLALDGQELVNSSRAIAHMTPTLPTRDDQVGNEMLCACSIRIPYDDSWPELRDTLGDDPYIIENAPWYDPTKPQSAEFAGVWLMDLQGFDAVNVNRTVAESICAGGSAGLARDSTRVLTFSALIIACTNAGAEYGKNWLACQLRSANTRRGVPLDLYIAHPSGTTAPAASLRRQARGVVLTKSPKVTDFAGKGGYARHRQASIYRAEWEMVMLSPYLYGSAITQPVTWDTTATTAITFAHAPDCEDLTSCDLPTIFNADCIPETIAIELAEIPTCGGCIPLCSIERRTWEMDSTGATCEETAVTVRVTNTSETDTLTVNFYWQPCGLDDEVCAREFPLQISGLAPGDTAVADSVTGRPYVLRDGMQHRQVGVISTQNGAPWRPMVIDPMMCRELIAESVPGAEYAVEIVTQDRDA